MLQERLTAPGAKAIADRDTPLILDAWYFVALASDLGRSLSARTVVDTRVVLYRTAAGEVVALHDRCPHRSFPLSRGSLDRDVVICGYRGMAFDHSGRCVGIPANDRARTDQIGVRRFPLVERGPILWIWPGDPDRAAITPVPDCDWLLSHEWSYRTGAFDIDANYVAMHENLLDLTHFAFLHGDTVGTPEYARSPYIVKRNGDRVGVARELRDHPAPPAYDRFMNLRGRRVTRGSEAWFDSPGAHLARGWFENPHPDADERACFQLRFAHLITPVSTRRFHYQYFVGRDFLPGNVDADKLLDDTTRRAFLQDADALQWIEEVMETERPGYRELSFASDKAGLEMRRVLARRAADIAPSGLS